MLITVMLDKDGKMVDVGRSFLKRDRPHQTRDQYYSWTQGQYIDLRDVQSWGWTRHELDIPDEAVRGVVCHECGCRPKYYLETVKGSVVCGNCIEIKTQKEELADLRGKLLEALADLRVETADRDAKIGDLKTELAEAKKGNAHLQAQLNKASKGWEAWRQMSDSRKEANERLQKRVEELEGVLQGAVNDICALLNNISYPATFKRYKENWERYKEALTPTKRKKEEPNA